MKYRENVKGKQPRGSKNNLTKGAFGIYSINIVDLKVLPKHLRTPETCNECGVKGQKITFIPEVSKPIVPQTKKGKIESTYTPYKVKKNKYIPNSKGKVKKNV